MHANQLTSAALQDCLCKQTLKARLRLIYKCDLDLKILLSDAISIEDFLSPKIPLTSDSDKYLMFPHLRNYTPV